MESQIEFIESDGDTQPLPGEIIDYSADPEHLRERTRALVSELEKMKLVGQQWKIPDTSVTPKTLQECIDSFWTGLLIAETQHEAASKNPEVVFDIESFQNRIHALLVSFREISVFLEGCPDPSSSPQKRNLRRRFNDISSDGESGHEATAKSSRGD